LVAVGADEVTGFFVVDFIRGFYNQISKKHISCKFRQKTLFLFSPSSKYSFFLLPLQKFVRSEAIQLYANSDFGPIA
jgi:hypothetical protein